jgi:hypothetical protein
MSAGNLDELCERLNECVDAHDAEESISFFDGHDLSSLPTFGTEIRETEGIYSWDDTRQLVPDYQGTATYSKWKIEPREDLV